VSLYLHYAPNLPLSSYNTATRPSTCPLTSDRHGYRSSIVAVSTGEFQSSRSTWARKLSANLLHTTHSGRDLSRSD